MIFKNPYLTIKEKIELLEYWIIFQSYLYYEKDTSIVSDNMYDNNTKQLLWYKEIFKKEFISSKYYPYFKHFNSGTGYDLFRLIRKDDNNQLINRILFDSKKFLK